MHPSSMAMKTQNLTYFVVTILPFWGHVRHQTCDQKEEASRAVVVSL